MVNSGGGLHCFHGSALGLGLYIEGLFLNHRDMAGFHHAPAFLQFALGEQFVLGYFLDGADIAFALHFKQFEYARPRHALARLKLRVAYAEPEGTVGRFHALALAEMLVAVLGGKCLQ